MQLSISPCVMCVDDKESPYDSTQAAVGKTSRFGYLGVLQERWHQEVPLEE